MKLTILDYGAGNLFSVARACSRLGYDAVLSSDRDIIAGSDKVIFPGVGNAVTAMSKIREEGLDTVIPALQQPLLGICLGMQLLFAHSEEGDTPCLGIVDGSVKDFSGRDMGSLKVPHMGWNIIDRLQGRLFRDIDEGSYMYFVHSYYVPLVEEAVAASYYNGIFTAAVERDNFFGCQFHPEKSGETGMQILKNFLEL